MVICKKDEFFHVIRFKKESKCKKGCARIPAHPLYVLLSVFSYCCTPSKALYTTVISTVVIEPSLSWSPLTMPSVSPFRR